MIHFDEETYRMMCAYEGIAINPTQYSDIDESALAAINKFIDFINNAKFEGFEYKPRRKPNPYYFIPDYSNRALSVLIVIKFRYKDETFPLEVESRYGGMDGLIDSMIQSQCGRRFDKPYFSPEYIVRSYMIRQSYKQGRDDLQLIYWPQYSKMVTAPDELSRMKSVLDNFALKNTRICAAHQKALMKHETYSEFGHYLENYKDVMNTICALKSKGFGLKEIERLYKDALKYSHEVDFMTASQCQELVNLKQVQSVHNK